MSDSVTIGTKTVIERTHKVEILADRKAGVRVRIHRELIVKVEGVAEKVYRAVGVPEHPSFRPVIELNGAEIIAAQDYEWTGKDDRLKMFDPEDLYFVIRAFCDSVCKKCT